MRNNKFNTSSDAFMYLLNDLLINPEYICSPRGQKIHEVKDYYIEIMNPTSDSIVTEDFERNEVIANYSEKEKALYNTMSTKVEDFTNISKFWSKLANPNRTVNSAYGYLIKGLADHGDPAFEAIDDNGIGVYRTPWQWCIEALKTDKDTRQAVMRFSRPEHFWVGVKDFTCTLHGNWLIRNNKLFLSIVMRSNDIVKGFCFDVPWFISLMEDMLQELKPVYPDLEMGSYSHFAHSMHIYESSFNVVKKMLNIQ